MIVLPRDDLKKQQYLEQIASKFEDNKKYTEQEVNDIIKSFDPEDHVLFRRELINFNYLGRDPYKGVYWLKTRKLSPEELEKIGLRQKKINQME